jgi:aminoglycoside phosphotransferase family enzyme
VQTHISFVFVADDFVYKIKKPVNFGFLDFSSLEKRRYFCHQEVSLNRRLSKDIYVGVLPVRFTGERHVMGEASGEIVEYAVKMKRIPHEALMKSVFEKRELTEAHLHSIARVLSSFHRAAFRNKEVDRFGEPESVKINTDENFLQVEPFLHISIEKDTFTRLKRWTEAFYAGNRGLFLQRIAEKRIRDCHGDLHMEHICLMEGIPIIDCIEFNERFRYSDTLADIAFLLMDLDYRGGRVFSDMLWKEYERLANESNVEALLTFYKVYRAFVRGKVNSFRLNDKGIGDSEKQSARNIARKYFKLADSYIQESNALHGISLSCDTDE